MATAAKNIKLQEGDRVLLLGEEFPSLYYSLQKLCGESKAEMITVPRRENGDQTSAVLAAIDDRTKVVAITPVHWTDGAKLNLKAVAERSKDIGSLLLIDGCQSAGVQPFDVNEIKPDYLIVPTYKWMLGPYSFGFMYVAAKHQAGSPLEENWASRIDSEEFARLVDYRGEYAAGARRFDMGEKSNFIHLPMAIRALEQILEWQPERIQNRLQNITKEIAEVAVKRGFRVYDPEHRCNHILGVRSTSGFSNDMKARFINKKIYVSFRGSSLRISPHLNITRADLDKLLSELRDE